MISPECVEMMALMAEVLSGFLAVMTLRMTASTSVSRKLNRDAEPVPQLLELGRAAQGRLAGGHDEHPAIELLASTPRQPPGSGGCGRSPRR